MTELRIATRRSELARTQAASIARMISTAHPDLTVSLVEITTTGDRDRTSPVTSLTEMGAFVRAVQQAVLDGRADLAVHSCKDLPTDGPAELAAWYPEREAPWDVLCGLELESLGAGGRVGTGSPRRAAQLALLRPGVTAVPIRGNVDTRIRLAKEGEVDAVVLAEAGLRRIGRTEAIDYRFSLEEMVPAPAQAALCLEAHRDGPVSDLLETLDHGPTRTAVETERRLLAETGAGCRSALGALAQVGADTIRLDGFVSDERGSRRGTVTADHSAGAVAKLRSELDL